MFVQLFEVAFGMGTVWVVQNLDGDALSLNNSYLCLAIICDVKLFASSVTSCRVVCVHFYCCNLQR